MEGKILGMKQKNLTNDYIKTHSKTSLDEGRLINVKGEQNRTKLHSTNELTRFDPLWVAFLF